MNLQLILIALLLLSAGVFLVQCITQAGMNIDAAYVIGFCTYFDMFGFFYKKMLPGNALFLLIAVPLIPALLAWFGKSRAPRALLRDPGIGLWGAVFLLSTVSLTWAPPDSGGLTKIAVLFIHAAIPGIYAYILYRKYTKFSWTIFALFGLAFAAAHLAFGEYSPEYPGRLSLPGSNPIFNARMSLITITVCLWAPGIPRIIRLAGIAAAAASALATESRGPVAAFAIANALILAMVLYRKWRRGEFRHLARYAAIVPVLLIGTGLAAANYSAELEEWAHGSRLSIFMNLGELVGDANFLGRMELQRQALEQWTEQPFLGGGVGSLSPPAVRDHPHNVVLEIAGEQGVAGLLVWSFAFLYALWMARRHSVLLVLLLQTLGTAMMSGDFGFNFEYVMFAFLALALAPAGRPVPVLDSGLGRVKVTGAWTYSSEVAAARASEPVPDVLDPPRPVSFRVEYEASPFIPESRRCSRKMRKMMFLLTGLNYAGAETQVVQLCRGFRERGCQIEVVSMLEPAAYLEELRAMGIPVHSLGMKKGVPDPRAIFRLRRLVAKLRPDIVHSHLVHANLLARVTRLFVRMPRLICTAHNRNEGGRLREFLYRLTDPLCDLTTNVSRDAVDRYIERRVVPARKIRYVPNGIDTAQFRRRTERPRAELRSRLARELGVSEEAFLWLAAGRLAPEKDYRTMLNAFALAIAAPSATAGGTSADDVTVGGATADDVTAGGATAAEATAGDENAGDTNGGDTNAAEAPAANAAQCAPASPALLIAGIGPERAELEELCRSLGIERQVHFLGMRRDIPELMAAADGYVMSSLWEGMPIVLLEAAASALPIVATDVGGNREVVRDGESGWLAAPDDPRQLCERMLALTALTPLARREMGERGRRYVEEHFELEVVLDQWADIYEQRGRGHGRGRLESPPAAAAEEA